MLATRNHLNSYGMCGGLTLINGQHGFGLSETFTINSDSGG
jgi:hypothetical protein